MVKRYYKLLQENLPEDEPRLPENRFRTKIDEVSCENLPGNPINQRTQTKMSNPTRLSQIHASLAIAQTMEVERQEFLAYMTFRENRRPMFTEPFGPIIGLKEEWAAQGASPEELNLSAFRYRRPQYGNIPVNTGWLGEESEEIVDETSDHILAYDARRRLVKLPKGYASLPLPMAYPVQSMKDWLKLKPHYEFSAHRFGQDWERVASEHLQAGRVLTASIPGGFDELRELMGDAK